MMSLFADAVHRRVRHLREQLLEIVVKQLRLVREDGQGRVVAHRADGLVAVRGHRRHEDLQVLGGVAEGLLAPQDRGVVWLVQPRAGRQVLQRHEVVAQPLAVRLFRGDLALQFVVGDDAALFQIDEEHAARLQAALRQHALRRDVEDADLGRHDDQVVLGDVIARRPQAVAVEHGADAHAVGEGDRRGAVPRLHQARMELVKRLFLRRSWTGRRPTARGSSS